MEAVTIKVRRNGEESARSFEFQHVLDTVPLSSNHNDAKR
jgi:hypothetical protein